MERATGTEVYGCGSTQSTDITLNIQTTTGGNFSISLNGKNTVEHLKKLVSRKLMVSRDRICLLHRERQLREGTLEENGLLDGSRVILLPSVETGLLSQRCDNSVMQALESLNDTQINDFLSGKSPLNLTMRLGDHMMLIQLQLSTLRSSSSGTRSVKNSNSNKNSASSKPKFDLIDVNSPQTTAEKPTVTDKTHVDNEKIKQEPHVLKKQDLEMLQNAFDIYRTMAEEKYGVKTESSKEKNEATDTNKCSMTDLSNTTLENEQSPIKSLSNLVSSPIDTSKTENKGAAALVKSVKSNLINLLTRAHNKQNDDVIPSTSAMCDKPSSSHTPDSSLSDDSDNNFTDQSPFLAENTIDEYPMENLFNSAVDKGLFEDQDETIDREISNLATTSHGQDSNAGTLPSIQSITEPLKNKRFQYLLHKTSKFKHPISQNKQKAFMQSVVNKHRKRMQNRQDSNTEQASTSQTEPYITNSRKLILQPSSGEVIDNETPSTSKQVPFRAPEAPKKPQRASPTPEGDTKALLEASKNLTQKLKKLSKEVLTNKTDLKATEKTVRKRTSGAVIECMKHHGKGVYTGTFSGTLNPSLQDGHGRPKKDISTIVHILNDLLCASPPLSLVRKEKIYYGKGKGPDKSKCVGCSQPSCPYGKCEGHLPSTSSSKKCKCDVKECECNRLEPDVCLSCTGKTSEEVCNKCDMAKALAMDNTKTKCKLEQLRLVMQQKKQRREARKLKTMPYSTSTPKTIASPEQTPVMQEEIETVA